MWGINAQQYFWKFDAITVHRITDEMALIRSDFLPGDLQPLMADNGFERCVTVQARQPVRENIFQLANAENHDFSRDVDSWTDLQTEYVSQKLDYFSGFQKPKRLPAYFGGGNQKRPYADACVFKGNGGTAENALRL
jgi:L-fuconolactonase